MPRANKKFVPLVFLVLVFVAATAAQQAPPPSTPIGSQAPTSQPTVMAPATPAPQQPQQQVPQQQPQGQQPQNEPAQPANQPGDTVRVPAQQQGQAPDQQEGGVFIFRKKVEEVTLHATVVDDRQRLVTNLDKNAFVVFEDGQPQQITSFRREDIPVSLGIVIDNSGTMREKRPAVNLAAVNLVRASNPQDEVFIVNFNEEAYLDQDYTNNVDLMKDALDRVASRGGTALYDALVAASDHLRKSAKLDKRAILVITDGEDNASRENLESAVRKLSSEGGPTVYSIGLLDQEEKGAAKRAKRALRLIAEQTGGVSFFPANLEEVDGITRQVAHDIRNQYTLGYKPTNPKTRGGYRTVRVEAKAPGYKRLTVRTRTGYYAGNGETQAAANNK